MAEKDRFLTSIADLEPSWYMEDDQNAACYMLGVFLNSLSVCCGSSKIRTHTQSEAAENVHLLKWALGNKLEPGPEGESVKTEMDSYLASIAHLRHIQPLTIPQEDALASLCKSCISLVYHNEQTIGGVEKE